MNFFYFIFTFYTERINPENRILFYKKNIFLSWQKAIFWELVYKLIHNVYIKLVKSLDANQHNIKKQYNKTSWFYREDVVDIALKNV